MDALARLTVLGSLNMDISVTVPALPAPGETVLGGAATFAPGGKGANQAVAAARLGVSVRVSMVGCVGDDEFGRVLRSNLTAEGIDDRGVRTVHAAPTGIAMITVDEAGENIITVAPGANREVSHQDVARLRETAEPPSVLIISAEVPVTAILAALPAAPVPPALGSPALGSPALGSPALGSPALGPLTVLNLAPAPPRPAALDILKRRPDWLVVNESEAATVLGRPVGGLREAARAAADLVTAGARNAVVTAAAAGAACQLAAEPSPRTVQGFAVQARDTVGAGDTFVGALAVTLAAGVRAGDAVTAASAAAAAAATRPGTQAGMPRPADVRAVTGYEWPVTAAQ